VNTFTRADGRTLKIVEGFRERLLSYRPSVTPKADWADADYQLAAGTKRKRLKRLAASFKQWGKSLKGDRVLDVGCGDGVNCLLLALEERIQLGVGIDLSLPARAAGERGERTRRLLTTITGGRSHLPVEFLLMDGTQMGFADECFDLVLSRSAMEHVRPIDRALAEIVRVTRKGGIIYLGIDPFFWVRGCHKRGVTDIPWAHARLSLDEFGQFVSITEGTEAAQKRRTRLETLNRLTVAEWRALVEQIGCELLDFKLKHSELGEQLLTEHGEVVDTLLPGVAPIDLLTERIEVWLRKR
jgi:SAM-dependent methyltransferase